MKEIPRKFQIFKNEARTALKDIELGYRLEPIYRMVGVPFLFGFIVGAIIF